MVNTQDCIHDSIIVHGANINRFDRNYGYIQRGQLISNNLYEILSFVEKPLGLVSLWEGVLCNTGIYLLTPQVWQKELQLYQEQMYKQSQLIKYKSHFRGNIEIIELNLQYLSQFSKVSMDSAVIQYSQQLLLSSVDLGWKDFGNWKAIKNNNTQMACKEDNAKSFGQMLNI